ncbi:MAG: DUF1592 domain-containing protein [Verrucomicrobiales bacterium]|nr:DUF1592 domain-containing protein [Verrucomicrobiales bacterium]
MMRFQLTLAGVMMAGGAFADAPKPVVPFFNQHCFECHDDAVAKANLDLTALAFDPEDPENFKQWQRIFERVQDGEMPPAEEPQPAKDEARVFLGALRTPLLEVDARDVAEHGRVHSRRLTRRQYEYTVQDLLGIDIPLMNLLPEDPMAHGFETVASAQQLSHFQLASYLEAADQALDEAFTRALEGDAKWSKFVTAKDTLFNRGGNYRGPDLRNGESISWPITLQFFGRMSATTVPASGWYRITLKSVRAIHPGKDGAVWGTLRSGECESNAPMLYPVGLVEATAKPRDLVFEAWIQEGHRLELKPNHGAYRKAPTGAKGGNVSFKGRDLEAEGFSGIAHRGIQMERIYPVADRAAVAQNLFGVGTLKEAKAQPKVALRKMVKRFAERAFRRPVSEEQAAPYVELGLQSLAAGDALSKALRASYRAILCSPRFLSLVEAPGPLDDYAVASRLSYALWLTLPDEELLGLAREGRLRDPETLGGQVERMLKDGRAERFIASYTDQWLKLSQIDFTTPDPRQFRTFDAVLQESMVWETRRYFQELLEQNLSVTTVVDSEFVFLNGRLAEHYNISAKLKPGAGLQKVALPPDDMRGGLMTQGAVLKVTADGTHTSPVVRGVFINERILGQKIHPPPPGIPAIEPDTRGAVSIRDQLDKHRNNESCAACHRTIDPPGFALESFDPVGLQRSRYGTTGKGAKVDPSGVTPDGVKFVGLRDWQRIYVKRGEELARGFVGHFLTYATGATPRFSDEPVIAKMTEDCKKEAWGVRSLIKACLTSSVFLKK